GITAGAGHSVYTAQLFPKDWHNQRVLICAPTCKIVSAPRLERHGAGFKTTNYSEANGGNEALFTGKIGGDVDIIGAGISGTF
ncbi:MAG TPA: hypothetical protein DHV60_00900, partial [Verrucomicrobiales bacterium]|nr:hypothetical protein [Verrucomicrobiales bacterium]